MKKDSFSKKVSKILNEEETFVLSLLLLAQMHEDDKYKDIADLIFLFDNYKGFKKFIKYYEGTTINVPSINEVKQTLRLLDLFQKVKVDNLDFNMCYDKLKFANLGFTKEYCKTELDKFETYLRKNGNITLKQIRKLRG